MVNCKNCKYRNNTRCPLHDGDIIYDKESCEFGEYKD